MSNYFSPAKINWFLHITGRRADGYHLLETVFQRIDWCDELQIETRNDGAIRLTGDLSGVDMQQNLAYRAANALRQYVNQPLLGANIHLTKHIPTGAGLGGGSSNAATVLNALNQLWHVHLSNIELQKIGLSLGADVPFFVSGYNAAHATGVGEVLTPLELPVHELLLVNPHTHIPTAAVFQHPQLQRNHAPLNLSTPQLAQQLSHPSADLFFNDLEKSTFAINPTVHDVYRALRAAAPDAWVRMSGSGATVFALPQNTAQKAALLDWQKTETDWLTRWVRTCA